MSPQENRLGENSFQSTTKAAETQKKKAINEMREKNMYETPVDKNKKIKISKQTHAHTQTYKYILQSNKRPNKQNKQTIQRFFSNLINLMKI